MAALLLWLFLLEYISTYRAGMYDDFFFKSISSLIWCKNNLINTTPSLPAFSVWLRQLLGLSPPEIAKQLPLKFGGK
jgi:hypothetical protein